MQVFEQGMLVYFTSFPWFGQPLCLFLAVRLPPVSLTFSLTPGLFFSFPVQVLISTSTPSFVCLILCRSRQLPGRFMLVGWFRESPVAAGTRAEVLRYSSPLSLSNHEPCCFREGCQDGVSAVKFG